MDTQPFYPKVSGTKKSRKGNVLLVAAIILGIGVILLAVAGIIYALSRSSDHKTASVRVRDGEATVVSLADGASVHVEPGELPAGSRLTIEKFSEQEILDQVAKSLAHKRFSIRWVHRQMSLLMEYIPLMWKVAKRTCKLRYLFH